MNSIIVIHSYFGEFPDIFPFWIESCKQNQSIDFLIVTDQEIYSDSDNIIIKKCTLYDIKTSIESLVNMPIWLEKAYKLCDYRPLFGQLFSDYTRNYVFWGYCDCDLVFGDIRAFFTEEVLNHYDYIMGWGHFHIQRTIDSKFEKTWKSARGLWRDIGWKEVFKSDQNEWFDELPYGASGCYYEHYPNRCWMGYSDNHVCYESPAQSKIKFSSLYNNYDLWKNWEGFQAHLERLPFLYRDRGGDLHDIIYEKEGKNLYVVGFTDNGKVEKRPILYVHFYKRLLVIKTTNYHNYLIVPNAIINKRRILTKLQIRWLANNPPYIIKELTKRFVRRCVSYIKRHYLNNGGKQYTNY